MRKVSQSWLQNQNQTIRESNLLRVDFFSPQLNNNRATYETNYLNGALSNMNNIKSIFPYDESDKNGYVSSILSDLNGNVSSLEHNVSIGIEDYLAPLDGLTITWSKNKGYAIDFDIELEGVLYEYRGYDKNTVFIPYIELSYVEYPTFKIFIKKWSEPNAFVSIERIFVGLYLSYREKDIFSFKENKINSNLGLELPQNSISFSIENLDHKFDLLYPNNFGKYLTKSTEIRTYYGYGTEWIKGGTYYLSQWLALANSNKADFVANDLINLFNHDERDVSINFEWRLDSIINSMFTPSMYSSDYFKFENAFDPSRKDPLAIYSNKWYNIRKNKLSPYRPDSIALDIENSEYVIYDENGIFISYNRQNGVYTITGTPQINFELDELFLPFDIDFGQEFTLSTYFLSHIDDTDELNIILNGEPPINIFNSEYQSGIRSGVANYLILQFDTNQYFDNFRFKLQLERGQIKTDYFVPVENSIIEPPKKAYTTRELLQYIAQSVNCSLLLDYDSNFYFVRNRFIENENAFIPYNILYAKPELSSAEPIRNIELYRYDYTISSETQEVYREEIDIQTANVNNRILIDTPSINGQIRFENIVGSVSVNDEYNIGYPFYDYVLNVSAGSTATMVIDRSLINVTNKIDVTYLDSRGRTLTLENPLVVDKRQSADILNRVTVEMSNRVSVELELRMDPAFDVMDLIGFPFEINGLAVLGFIRVDELELNYNGAYRGKLKGKYLLSDNLDLSTRTYILKSGETIADEETLLWHLQSN